MTLKRFGQYTAIAATGGAVLSGGLSTVAKYYGIEEMKTGINKLVTKQDDMSRSIGRIEGALQIRGFNVNNTNNENTIKNNSSIVNGHLRYSDVNQLRTEYSSDERKESGSRNRSGATSRGGI